MPYADPEARKAYHRARRVRLTTEWFESQGNRCARCGSTERLEIDHIDPATKRWETGELWNRKESDRAGELAKCQALCYECHKLKTIVERSKFEHGRSCYCHRGCRCEICVDANVEYMVAWRERNPNYGKEVVHA